MENKAQIARLVFDESHQMYLARDLRVKLQKFSEIGQLPFPMVFLTATLPPHLIESFKLGLGLGNETMLIRKTTERPEIQYSVLKFDNVKDGPTVYDLAASNADQYSKSFDEKSRGIIFSRSIEGAKKMGDKMDCAIYHSEMSFSDLQKRFDDWKSGKNTWIVATSGFTNGIDYAFVDVVIFMEPPYGLMDFVQGSGRGGRGGRPSKTLLITSWKNREREHNPDKAWKCMDEMLDFIDKDDCCRRTSISLCMDGRVLECKNITNAQLCDVCSGSLQTAPKPPAAHSITRFASPGYSDVSAAVAPVTSTSINLDDMREAARKYLGSSPTNKTIWTALRSKHLNTKKHIAFLWKLTNDALTPNSIS